MEGYTARPRAESYCDCETPVMDVEHDAGCRRCGLPVDFSPKDSDSDEEQDTIYVGVDLATERVVLITRYSDMARESVVLLRGRPEGEGMIVLDSPGTWNGRRAAYVALASQGCGLGWSFKLAPPDPARTLADLWST